MAAKSNGRGGPRHGAGRKPKPPDEKRGNRVVVHLTDEELAALEASGDEPAGALAREIVVRWLARRRK